MSPFDPFKDLDKRTRLALRQALESGTGSYAAPTEVVKKLEKHKLARRSGHVHAPQEWGKIVRRWPVFVLTEEGTTVARSIVDALRGPVQSTNHSTVKSPAQLDAEIAEALGANPEAARASEFAKRLSDDVFSADDHRAAAKEHRRAARLHKSTATGADIAWLHDLAAINHKQAAAARASRALKAADPSRTQKTFAAFKEKLSAANEHTSMAQEYARQAIAAARKRA